MRALSHWSEILATDRRALGVFRIAMGLVLLFDIAHRLFDLEAHYLDLGAVPRALALAEVPAPLPFRLFFLSGGPAVTATLLCLFGAAAVMLVLGRFSRVATALCWLFWCALMARDPFVINFGDRILRLMLFWSIFLPLGSTLSWDARRRPPAADLRARIVSVGTAAYLVQIVLVYFIGALLKNDPVWTTGQAVQYTLHFDQLTLPLGQALTAYPRLLGLLTFATLALEGVVVLFAFSPLWNGACRLLVVASIVAFHLGLALTLRLGHFPFVCMVAWIPFLPSFFWDRILARPAGRTLGPAPPGRLSAAGAVAGAALALVVAINLDSLREGDERGLPAPLAALARYTGLDQRWSMFAPKPLRIDGWFVISGQQRDGRLVDLWSGEAPARWTKPEDPGARYPNHRWMSYMVKLHIDRDRSQQKRYLADYLCRRWNRAHDAAQQVDFVAIDFVQELTLAGGREDQPIPIKLLRQPCANAPEVPSAALWESPEPRDRHHDASLRSAAAPPAPAPDSGGRR